MSERGGAQRGIRFRDRPTARATMRLLLRLLLLLVLSSYLLRHYGTSLRESLWHVQSAGNGELLNRIPGITKDHPQGGLAEANLPPGVLPRHDLTPGAMDPRVTQSNIVLKAISEIPSVGEATRRL